MRWPGLLVAGLIVGAALAETESQAPQVGRVVLGKSTLRDVLIRLGPPDALYLSGADSESGLSEAEDPIVVRYEAACRKLFARSCSLLFFVTGPDYLVEGASVPFPPNERPELSSILEQYGETYRTVHLGEVEDGGGEATLGECDDPRGNVPLLIFQEHGLKVFLENTDPGPRVVSKGYAMESRRLGKKLGRVSGA